MARAAVGFKRVVALTGAGISAESGIPTFRDPEGFWQKHRPEELASPQGFRMNPKLVWDWYLSRAEAMKQANPNPGHLALALLQDCFEQVAVITQNVDGLHEAAGSRDVVEIHGSLKKARCTSCSLVFPLDKAGKTPDGLPACPECGRLARPDVVWFGEMIPEEALQRAFDLSASAQLFFVVGTSAVVHPAALLPSVASRAGALIVEVNPEETPVSSMARFVFRNRAGQAMPVIQEELCEAAKAQ